MIDRDRHELTEMAWELKWAAQRQRLRLSSHPPELDFRLITWFDLWPLVELAKILRARAKQRRTMPLIDLPVPAGMRTQEAYKPLCFLVDSGFVAFAAAQQCRIHAGGRQVRVELSESESCGLSTATQARLREQGYISRQWKDQILMPLKLLSRHGAVEDLRLRLWDYVRDQLPYYAAEFADGNFIDTFFREIAENAIEHSGTGEALVAARVLRSIIDLPEERREDAREARARGKSREFKSFLAKYKLCGVLELLVVDDGCGIGGTVAAIEDSGLAGAYRLALDPEWSRYTKEERRRLEKSPLTGLGACLYSLDETRGYLLFREARECMCVLPQEGPKADQRARVLVGAIEREDSLVGCNAQFLMPVEPRGEAPVRLQAKLEAERPGTYVRASTDWLAPPLRIKREAELLTSLESASLVVVDVTNTSADKDTAFALLHSIATFREEHHAPVVIVGISRSLLSRLWGLARFVEKKAGGSAELPTPVGVLAVTIDCDWHCVSQKSALSRAALAVLSGKTFAASDEVRKFLSECLRLTGPTGEPRFTPSDVIGTWWSGMRSALAAWISGERERFCTREAVRLPGGTVVKGYLSVYELLRHLGARAVLQRLVALGLSHAEVQYVVSYTATAREVLAGSLPQLAHPPRRIDLPDPFVESFEAVPLKSGVAPSAMIVADAIFRGKQLGRIVSLCDCNGVAITEILAVVDTRDGQTTRTLPRVSSAIQHTLEEVFGAGVPTLRVDPLTLCLEETDSEQPDACRDLESSEELFGLLQHQKAVVTGHFVSRHGHHMVAALDLVRFASRGLKSIIQDKLVPLLRRARTVVVVEGSAMETLLAEVARENRGRFQLARVIPVRGREHRFSMAAADRKALCEGLDARREVVLADDAYTTGRVLRQVGPLLHDLGCRAIHFVTLVDNSEPGSLAPSELGRSSQGSTRLRVSSLFRTNLPVFDRARPCPLCRIRSSLRIAADRTSNGLIRSYLRGRWRSLAPESLEHLVLTPRRCRHIGSTHVSVGGLPLPVPESVHTPEAVWMAIAEQVQDPSAVRGLVKMLGDTDRRGTRTLALVFWLSENFPLLWRSAVADTFESLVQECIARSQGETCARLLECLLLWPTECLVPAVKWLLTVRGADFWHSDSGIATMWALTCRVQQDADSSVAQELIEAARNYAESLRARDDCDPEVYALQALSDLDGAEARANARVAWAWKTLAEQIQPCRRPGHQLVFKKLAALEALGADLISVALGRSKSSTERDYLVGMLQLAKVGAAIRELLDAMEINSEEVGAVEALHAKIERCLALRVQLREAHNHPRPSDLRRIEGLSQELVKLIRDLKLAFMTESAFYQESAIVAEIRNHLLEAEAQVVEPLVAALIERLATEAEIARGSVAGRVHLVQAFASSLGNHRVLCEPIAMNALVSGIADNVREYSKRAPDGTIRGVKVGGSLGDGVLRIEIENECDEPEAARLFEGGRNTMELNRSLGRFGGRISADMTGQYITTVVELQTFG